MSFFSAPTMVKRLAGDRAIAAADLSHLKTIVYGGAPMYLADLEDALAVFGPRLAQIYGQGESPMTITGLSKADHADRNHPRWRVRGDVVMAGYWKQPDATAEAVREGWLHTGDVGSFAAFGYLTLRDRSKDLIISGGENIYPREVEEALLRHPGVRAVAVVGRPDAEWGEVVVAFVVAAAGAAPRRSMTSTRRASTTSPGSSGPRTTASSTPCRPTTMARSSSGNCATGSGPKRRSKGPVIVADVGSGGSEACRASTSTQTIATN
jgi:acyl-CoA synthetase (AMP-forming)/AMP-acid ligase II